MTKLLTKAIRAQAPVLQSKMKRILNRVTLAAVLAFLHHEAIGAQAPVDLGTAGNYVILAKTGISTVPASAVTGNMGVSPIGSTAITGFSVILDGTTQFSTSSQVVGKVYAPDYSAPTPIDLTTAVSDMQTAFADAAGRTLPDHTELGSGNIGGMTLAPGLYKWGTSVTIPTDVTLAGGPNDVWIFQIAGNLTMAGAKSVILSGGAQARNIFWQVAGGSGVNIGATSHFEGIILAQTAINLQTSASINGRLFAQSAVSLDSSTVTAPNTITSVAASLAGKTLLATIHDGSGALAATGKFQFVAATGTNKLYRLVPLSGTVAAQNGSYTYTKSTSTNAEVIFNGITMSLNFSNAIAGSYTATASGGTQSGTFIFGNTLADVNNEGLADIFFQRPDGVLAAWEMRGTNFLRSTLLRNGIPAAGWRAFGQADINGDGKADILFQNQSTRQLAVWFMNGTNLIRGTLLANGKTPASGWCAVGTANFNNDGEADILFRNENRASGVWFMKGTNFISSTLLRNGAAPVAGWDIVGSGDFNGDGQTDIVWQNTDGRIAVWHFNGKIFVNAVLLKAGPNAASGWKIRGIADFDFDGHTDLFWQNSDGRTACWFFDEANFLKSGLCRSAGGNWQMIGPR